MIFEGIKEGFILHEVIKDSKGRISDLRFVDLNPEAEKFFGRSKSELVGWLRSEMLGPLDSEALEIVTRASLLRRRSCAT